MADFARVPSFTGTQTSSRLCPGNTCVQTLIAWIHAAITHRTSYIKWQMDCRIKQNNQAPLSTSRQAASQHRSHYQHPATVGWPSFGCGFDSALRSLAHVLSMTYNIGFNRCSFFACGPCRLPHRAICASETSAAKLSVAHMSWLDLACKWLRPGPHAKIIKQHNRRPIIDRRTEQEKWPVSLFVNGFVWDKSISWTEYSICVITEVQLVLVVTSLITSTRK